MTAHDRAPTGDAVGEDLGRLAEEAWEGTLAAQPVVATSIGDRRFDDRLADPRPEARARRAEPARPARRPGEGDPGRRPRARRRDHSAGPDRVPRGRARPGDGRRGQLGGRPARRSPGPVPEPLLVPARRHAGRRRPARRALAGDGPVPRPARRERPRGARRGHRLARGPGPRGHRRARRSPRPAGRRRGRSSRRPGRPAGWSDADRRRFATELESAVREVVRPAFGRYRET